MKLTPCTVGVSIYAFAKATRCGAKTRMGTQCKSPAIRDKKRCRMHGGKGSGAPKGSQNALKHGLSTLEALNQLLHAKKLVNECSDFIVFNCIK